jgi:ubiquinone biosynthesis protein UbiJ
MPATAPWLASAEAMFNRRIDGSTLATELAHRLDCTSLEIEVEGMTRVRAAVQGGRLALLTAGAPPPADAVISASPSALLALLQDARPAAAPERAGMSIRGDAEIADLYRRLFLAARPDPEEELSRWIGDAAARGVTAVAGGMLSWARRARRTARQNIAEYLTEESRDLVARTEAEEFLHGVDEVREAADRVEARLKDLARRLQGSV